MLRSGILASIFLHYYAQLIVSRFAYSFVFFGVPTKRIKTLDVFSSSKNDDPVRSGNRASLHPTTINVLSHALLLRSKGKLVSSPPLEVVKMAGQLAIESMDSRKSALLADGDEDMLMTSQECETFSGRIIGVIVRFKELESKLILNVGATDWVKKFKDYDSFGLVEVECTSNGIDSMEIEKEVQKRILNDPLFRMQRAECLLALFLIDVEAPKMKKLKYEVPGGSDVDFLDQEKIKVLES